MLSADNRILCYGYGNQDNQTKLGWKWYYFGTAYTHKPFAAKLPRIDLRLATINSSLEYVYHMEAKNLKETDSGLKRRYIDTGINNFVSLKYENGCLLGYVLEGELVKTVDGVNNLLKKDKRDSENLKPKRHNLHHSYYESEHPDDLLIKHFMFDFSSLNSA